MCVCVCVYIYVYIGGWQDHEGAARWTGQGVLPAGSSSGSTPSFSLTLNSDGTEVRETREDGHVTWRRVRGGGKEVEMDVRRKGAAAASVGGEASGPGERRQMLPPELTGSTWGQSKDWRGPTVSWCVYMYVCLYVCVCVCMCVCMYIVLFAGPFAVAEVVLQLREGSGLGQFCTACVPCMQRAGTKYQGHVHAYRRLGRTRLKGVF